MRHARLASTVILGLVACSGYADSRDEDEAGKKTANERHATSSDITLRATIPARNRVAGEVPLRITIENGSKETISCVTGLKYKDFEIEARDAKNALVQRTRFGDGLVNGPVIRYRTMHTAIGPGKRLSATILVNRIFDLPPGDYAVAVRKTVTLKGQTVELALQKVQFKVIEEDDLGETLEK